MAISLRAVSTGPNSNATSTTISLPTGTTTGDVTIIAFTKGALYTDASPQSITVPAGWTTLCNGNGQGACYRAWQSGDPSSVTFTATATGWWESVAATYSGCDTTTPVDAYNSCVAISGGIAAAPPFYDLYLAPSINPSWQNDQLLAIYANSSISAAGTFTPPGGFTARVTSVAGPNVVIADQVLGTGNSPTGAQKATWNTTLTATVHTGIQVALKTAGASPVTPAAANTVWGSAIGISTTGAQTSWTFPLSKIAPQAGDLVTIFCTASTGGAPVAITGPTGYVQSATVNGQYLFTRTYQNGDADPVLTISTGYLIAALVCLRKSGASGISPVVDQSATAVGVGGSSPFSATIPSLTPANSTEYLIAAWTQSSTVAATFTAPGGLTTQANTPNAPGLLLMDTQPAGTPTGSFAGQVTTAGVVTSFGAIELLVGVQATAVGATQARAMVLA